MGTKAIYRLAISPAILLLCLGLAFSFSSTGRANEAGVQSDYQSYLPLVMRTLPYHESTGVFDESFGLNGLVSMNFPADSTDVVKALALQPDGKIIAVGYSYNDLDYDFALLRLHPDGSLDLNFGDLGLQITDFGGNDQARAVVVLPDDKILLAGYTDANIDFDFALARYNPDGSLDLTFDDDGMLMTDINSDHDSAYAIALQPDGKIIVAGFSHNGANSDMLLVRYNPDGSLDETFGGSGWVTNDCLSRDDFGYALGLQPDGKIVVGGTSSPEYGDSDFVLARFNPDGSLDTTFGGSGWLLTDFTGYYDRGKSLVLQPDGKIILAGDSNQDFALARYNSDGSLDTSFDKDGLLITDIYAYSDVGNAIIMQPDGKLVLAGTAVICKDTDFALARYMPDGNLDRSFDGDGMLISYYACIKDYGYALLQQPDGKLIVGGYINFLDSDDFMIARIK